MSEERFLFFNENYTERIQNSYKKLSNAEKAVADFVLTNGPDCVRMSVQELSEKIGCSSATIVRFCRSVGYSGFAELKFQISKISSNFSKENLSLSYHDTSKSLKQKALQFTQYNLAETTDIVDDIALDNASKVLAKAKRIIFCSMGSACGIALIATNHFLSMGLNASFLSDDLLLLRTVNTLNPNDVLVGINYDGYSKSVADAFKLAKKVGAITVFMTSYPNSLIAKYSDIILRTPVRNNANILNFSTTSMCQMMIIQLLVSGVWQCGGTSLDEKSKLTRPLTNYKRYPDGTKSI